MVDETFEDVEIPDWEPPARMQCKHYALQNGKDICKHGGDLRIINDDWCIGCGKYETGTIEAPKPEHKETMMASGRVGKVDWNQPAKNLYDAPEGVTLRQYLKEGIEEGGSVVVYADALGVTPGALVQAIKRVPASVKPAGALVARNSGKATGVKPENNIPADVTPEPEPVMMMPGGGEVLGMRCSIPGEDPEFDAIINSVADGQKPVEQPRMAGTKFNPLGVKIRKAPVDVDGEILWQGPAVDTFPEVSDHYGHTLIQYLARLCLRDGFKDLGYMAEALGCSETELFCELELHDAREQQKAKAQLKKQSDGAAGNGVPALQDDNGEQPQAGTPAPREQQEQPRVDVRQVQLMPSLEAAMAFINMYDKAEEFAMFCAGWNMRVTGDPSKTGGIVVVTDA